MKFLLDTNVFIPLEPVLVQDREELSDEVITLHRKILSGRHELFVHPRSRQDIQNDKISSRRDFRLRMFNKYPCLEHVVPPKGFLNKLSSAPEGAHDAIDNCLLFALYNNAVDFLITEDQKIHRRAARLGIDNRVVTVLETMDVIEDLHSPRQYLPLVRYVKAYQLQLVDQIFDGLREDYPGFENWFRRCQTEHRDCIVIGDDLLHIEGLCILKEETGFGQEPEQKTLKLCTFKISPRARGVRLGELLLKAAFKYAKEKGLTRIYVTAFRKNIFICNFLENYGFLVGPEKTKLGEDVFVKTLTPPPGEEDRRFRLDYHVLYGPYHVHPRADAFIVPIRTVYHERLFPEYSHQMGLFSESTPFGNGITKAYLCRSPVRKIRRGDLLFFYQSHRKMSVQAIGVVEDTKCARDANFLAAHVGKRTIYSLEHIQNMTRKGEVLAILFRQAVGFCKPIKWNDLFVHEILKGAPQTIQSISEDSKKWMLNRERG